MSLKHFTQRMYGVYNLKSARLFLDKLKIDRREISKLKEMNFIASNSHNSYTKSYNNIDNRTN